MARLLTSGFELNTVGTSAATTDPDGQNSGGTVVIDSAVFRSGAFSMKRSTTGSTTAHTWAYTVGALGTTYFGRVFFQVDAYPTAGTYQLMLFGGSLTARIDSTGGISIWNGTGPTQLGAASAPVALSTWIRLEVGITIGTGAVDFAELRLDGVVISTNSGISLTDVLSGQISIGLQQGTGGTVAGTLNIWLDDFALNDSTGASQTTWVGDSKIVLLKPVTDSAVGTGWTLGTGTAIAANSGATATQKEPPTGVADLAVGSDTKQIRNASANASVSYDAALTTYTAAGIAVRDIINVIIPIVSTGAPVTTSSKQGLIGLASNPAISTIALGAGGTSGAFWSGTTAGTYPAGWKWSFGTPTYAPSVTLGTAPVARITQVTSSTRIAMVDFIGAYVDYTPNTLPEVTTARIRT